MGIHKHKQPSIFKQKLAYYTSACWPFGNEDAPTASEIALNQQLRANTAANTAMKTIVTPEVPDSNAPKSPKSPKGGASGVSFADPTRKFTPAEKENMFVQEVYSFGKTLGSGTFGEFFYQGVLICSSRMCPN
jgi:hypothetical protein